ncbi:hypothetical protein C8R45DRAFT_825292 [Mycena sanguinolenta]|nr:hypothetical protein C8R45DRAFT_825292 [Mycena sanguinolenta]
MCSSGISGANGHVVLEAPPAPQDIAPSELVDQPMLLAIGGMSPRSTTALCEQAIALLRNLPKSEWPLLATIFGRRARQMSFRSWALVDPKKIAEKQDEGESWGLDWTKPVLSPRETAKVVFVFSGQGPQHVAMGRQLFAAFPAFRKSILEMDETFLRVTGKSVVTDYGLFGAQTSAAPFAFPAIWPIALTLPSIAIFQIAFFDLLISLGIKPDMLVGHSAGETALLYTSGAAPKAMAVELAIIRGRTFSKVESAGGTMAALSCTEPDAVKYIDEYKAEFPNALVELACLNALAAVALSGEEKAIEGVLAKAKEVGVFGVKIRTFVPIHSSMMEMIKEEYLGQVQCLFARYTAADEQLKPTIPTYSTLFGSLLGTQFVFTPEYFWENTRGKVLFTPVIQSLAENSTFIEIAPHPVLSVYLSTMAGEGSAVLSTVYRPSNKPNIPPSSETHDLVRFFGKLVCAGYGALDFSSLNKAPYTPQKLSKRLPAYPFTKKSFPLYADVVSEDGKDSEKNYGPLNRARLKVNQDTHPSLKQHVIRGEPIWPAAAFLEMALEFRPTSLFNVSLHSMMSLSSEQPLPVKIDLDGAGAHWTVSSVVPVSPGKPFAKMHAEGYLSFEAPPIVDAIHIPTIRSRCGNFVDGSQLYPSLSYFSSYGPQFQRITSMYYNLDEALVSIRGGDASLVGEPRYISHPAIIDAVFQTATYRPFTGNFDPNAYYLPAKIHALVMHNKVKEGYWPAHLYAHVRWEKWAPDSMAFNSLITDTLGNPLCTLNFEFARHLLAPVPPVTTPVQVVVQSVGHGVREVGSNTHLLKSRSYTPLYTSLTLIDYQKTTSLSTPSTSSPFTPETDLVYTYALGREMELRQQLLALVPEKELTIWIVSSAGVNSAAGAGMVRALRREYLYWCLRFVELPAGKVSAAQMEEIREMLEGLPSWVKEEPDLVLDGQGTISVPRLVPIPDPSEQLESTTLVEQASVSIDRVVRVSKMSPIVAAFASCANGTRLIGLQIADTGNAVLDLDLDSMVEVPEGVIFGPDDIDGVAGLVTALLALPALASLRRLPTAKLRAPSVLVTHADTSIGSVVRQLLEREGVSVTATSESVSLLDLATGKGKFDLLVSGYEEDSAHAQVLRATRRFFWEIELPRYLSQKPTRISDVLAAVFSKRYQDIHVPGALLPVSILSAPPDKLVGGKKGGAVFSAEKTYVLLGGLGNIGAHLALYLFQHGACHIIATSRSGEKTLARPDAVIVRRIYAYLRSQPNLSIRIEATDASSPASMSALFASIPKAHPVGGVIALAAVLRDKLLVDLSEQDFQAVYGSKISAVEVLLEVADVSKFEFVMTFSSMVGVFGTGGQTSYCVANLVIEEMMSQLPNAFAFVCPAVFDSSIMHEGSTKPTRLGHLMRWAMSQEELILWVDDAFAKHQAGARFSRYMPSMPWEAFSRAPGDMPVAIGGHLIPSPKDDNTEPAEGGGDDVVSLQDQVEWVIRTALNVDKERFDPDVPLTSYGLDSLSAGRLSFSIRSLIKVTQLQLLGGNSLADLIRKYGNTNDEADAPVTTASAEIGMGASEEHVQMEALVAQYTALLDSLDIIPIPDDSLPAADNMVVLLTGTTGALGCHLLVDLLANDNVKQVYAFNRVGKSGKSLADRQRDALLKQGIVVEAVLGHAKLMLLEGELAEEAFGLGAEMYQTLKGSVTHLIHNAWYINVLSLLAFYEPLIKGTFNVLALAATAGAMVSFMSTHGVPRNLPSEVISAPEDILLDARVAVASGYTESKWVTERIVQHAYTRRYINANVVRVGQLCGSTTSGAWDTFQWVPALAQSAAVVGCLPDDGDNDTTTWFPIDKASLAVIDMLSSPNQTLHLVHPKPAKWHTIVSALASALASPSALITLVPYAEWYARLRATSTPEFSTKLDAVKLLDFFTQGLEKDPSRETMGLVPRVDMVRSVKTSGVLMNAAEIAEEDVRRWVAYWRGVGYL